MKPTQLQVDTSVAVAFSLSIRINTKGNIVRLDAFNLAEKFKKFELVADEDFNPKECQCDDHVQVPISHAALLVERAAKKRFPNLPKAALTATRKAALKQLQAALDTTDDPATTTQRITCKYNFCQQGTRMRPKRLFYPHEEATAPYCSKKCLVKQKEKFAMYLERRTSGGYRPLYKKDCTQCGKAFWHTKGRKRCEKCLQAPPKKRQRKKA